MTTRLILPVEGPFSLAGVQDALTLGEPRLADYLRHYYGLPEPPSGSAMERIAERWRPFRTWASVLFRVAGDRDELPFEQLSDRRAMTRTSSGKRAAG